VDFLSTKEVLEIFAEFSPKQVEWLDDSSCNVIFEEEVASQVIQDFAGADSELPEPWTLSKPITLGGGEAKQGKARRMKERTLRLELRLASEADRKDPGHSGHTDSVYYAHVKEQQALERERTELRRQQKRRRQSRLPPAVAEAEVQVVAPATGSQAPAIPTAPGCTLPGDAGAGAPLAAAATKAGEAPAASGTLRLGCRSALDPLLFLRASAGVAATGPSGGGGDAAAGAEAVPEAVPEAQRKSEDLRAALQRAESEYAAVLQPSQPEVAAASAPQGRLGRRTAPGAGVAAGRRRGREATPGRGPRERTPRGLRAGTPPPPAEGAEGARGRKRRPTEQEPRPVSEKAPPPRRIEALSEVEAFLAKTRIRCQRFALKSTFRGIMFGQQKKAGGKLQKAGGQEGPPEGKAKELPPWEQYFAANSHFTEKGQFMHTVAWEVEGRRILTIIPHPTRVDMDRLARAVQKPSAAIRQRKLKDIAAETGFPVFVCPPFGHPKDAQGMEPLMLIDSTVTELKQPLLFDCGTVGLSVPVSEFFRGTSAACIEGLSKAPPGPQPPRTAALTPAAPALAGTAAPLAAAAPTAATAAPPVVAAAPPAATSAPPAETAAPPAATVAPPAAALAVATAAAAPSQDEAMAEGC